MSSDAVRLATQAMTHVESLRENGVEAARVVTFIHSLAERTRVLSLSACCMEIGGQLVSLTGYISPEPLGLVGGLRDLAGHEGLLLNRSGSGQRRHLRRVGPPPAFDLAAGAQVAWLKNGLLDKSGHSP